jgi:phosphoribulokinase
MPRPIILGVVGDSAAGKTTMTRGLVRILGEEQVTAVSTDDSCPSTSPTCGRASRS